MGAEARWATHLDLDDRLRLHPVRLLLIATALFLQVVLAIGGSIVTAVEGGTFGAPLPSGRNPGLAAGLGAQADFWPIPFAVDVAITWALFWIAERALGRGAGLAAAIGR